MYAENRKKQVTTETHSLPNIEDYQFDKVNLWADMPDHVSTNDNVNFIEQFGISPEESFSSTPPLQGKGFRDKRPITQQVGGGYFSGTGKRLGLSGEMSENIQSSFGLDPKAIELRESPEVAKMGAKATAQGNLIRFAPGEFKPDTLEGRKVLGHELNHVREQAQGKIKANVEGTNLHYDRENEASSDRVGEAFASGTLSSASPVSIGNASAGGAAVQGILLPGALALAGAIRNRDSIAKGGKKLLKGASAVGNGILSIGNAVFGGIDNAVDAGARGIGGVASSINAARNGEDVREGFARGSANAGNRVDNLRKDSKDGKRPEGWRGWLPHGADWLPDESDVSSVTDAIGTFGDFGNNVLTSNKHLNRYQTAVTAEANNRTLEQQRNINETERVARERQARANDAKPKSGPAKLWGGLKKRVNAIGEAKNKAIESGKNKISGVANKVVGNGRFGKKARSFSKTIKNNTPGKLASRLSESADRSIRNKATGSKASAVDLAKKHPKAFGIFNKATRGAKKIGGAAKGIGKGADILSKARSVHKVGTAFRDGGLLGRDGYTGAVQEAATQVGKKKGMKAGGKAGAAIGKKAGAALGTLIPIPIVGTAVGAALGGLVGGFIGSRVGGRVGANAGEAVGGAASSGLGRIFRRN